MKRRGFLKMIGLGTAAAPVIAKADLKASTEQESKLPAMELRRTPRSQFSDCTAMWSNEAFEAQNRAYGAPAGWQGFRVDVPNDVWDQAYTNRTKR